MGFQLWERATCDVCGCAAPDVRLLDLRQTRILPVGWSTYASHTMVTEHRGEHRERVMCGKCVRAEGRVPMRTECETKVWEMLERYIAESKRLAENYPDERKKIATGMLGVAVAFCDSLGVDADGFIRRLRAQQGRA